jgi:hypothetical protein
MFLDIRQYLMDVSRENEKMRQEAESPRATLRLGGFRAAN